MMRTKIMNFECMADSNPMSVSFSNDRICFSINDYDNDERRQVCISRRDAGKLLLEMQRYFTDESSIEDSLARLLGMGYLHTSGLGPEHVLPVRKTKDVERCEASLRLALFGPHR